MSTAIAIVESRAPSAPTVDHARYLGGSDIAALLGIDPFRTQLSVWGEKVRGIRVPTNAAMEAGNDAEPAIVRGYTREWCERLARVESVSYPGPGTLLSPRDAWRGASPDAVAIRRRRRITVQAKLVGLGMAHEWGDPENGPEGVPEHVIVQVAWESLHLAEQYGDPLPEVAHVVAMIGTDRPIYEVPIDPQMVADLLDAGRDWWRRHVELGEMPIVTAGDGETVEALYPRARAALDANPSDEILELVRRYDAARAEAKRAALAKELAANELTAAIGEREGFGGRWGSATWRQSTRARTDWQAIAEALGAPADLIAKHTTETTGRRLDVRLKAKS
jgi:predicted phage-related endonuclease